MCSESHSSLWNNIPIQNHILFIYTLHDIIGKNNITLIYIPARRSSVQRSGWVAVTQSPNVQRDRSQPSRRERGGGRGEGRGGEGRGFTVIVPNGANPVERRGLP